MSIGHQVTIEELQKALYEMEYEVVSSVDRRGGKPYKKSIVVTANGGLVVKANDTVMWRGMQAYEAMEQYNEI